MKIFLMVLIFVCIGCAGTNEIQDCSWYSNLAVKDTVSNLWITPGLCSGDTLFRVDKYIFRDKKLVAVRSLGVWTIPEACERIKDQYQSARQELEFIREDEASIIERKANAIADSTQAVNIYKIFKQNFGINCIEVVR